MRWFVAAELVARAVFHWRCSVVKWSDSDSVMYYNWVRLLAEHWQPGDAAGQRSFVPAGRSADMIRDIAGVADKHLDHKRLGSGFRTGNSLAAAVQHSVDRYFDSELLVGRTSVDRLVAADSFRELVDVSMLEA